MKFFEYIKIKFEKPDWAEDPELGLIDTIICFLVQPVACI